MTELEHIQVERIERNKYRFYRILASEERQAGHSIVDAHLFAPGEMLELAAYVEQNRAQLGQEAKADEARNARAWSEDMKDMEQIKRECASTGRDNHMATYEERRDKRFHEATRATLNDIQNRLGTIDPSDDLAQSALRYAAAYGVLRGYVETLLTNFAESFSEDQLAEIRIVLDQLRKVVREDEYLDESTRAKLDQQAQALRESDEGFQLPEHDPQRDDVAEFNHEQAIKDFTELTRRMRTGSYQQGKDHEGSYGADRIEERIDDIMNAVAREGFAFIYHEEGDTYTLEPVPPEDEQETFAED